MEFNIISYNLFLFLMVLFLPSLIFAPWTRNNRPKSAPHDFLLTCHEWIVFNGFTPDKYPENVKRANERDVLFDREATTFAAMYAFHIGCIEAPSQIFPDEFCFSFDTNAVSITTLQEDYKTCPGWILLYGFLEYDDGPSTSNPPVTSYIDSDIHHNVGHARNQTLENMKATSLFVYSYYDYLTREGTQRPLKPSEFCTNLGIDVYEDAFKPFINTYGPELTCRAWIELYGFNDNVQYNASIAKNIEIRKFQDTYKIMHELPLEYVRRLLDLKASGGDWQNFTLLKFCKRYITMDENKKFNFYYTYSEPTWDGYA